MNTLKNNPTTMSTTSTPKASKEDYKKRYIAAGGAAAAILLGGGTAYAVTRPAEEAEEDIDNSAEEIEIISDDSTEEIETAASGVETAAPEVRIVNHIHTHVPEPDPTPVPPTPVPPTPVPPEPVPPTPVPPTPVPTPPGPDVEPVSMSCFIDDQGTIWVRIDEDLFVNENGEIWNMDMAESRIIIAFADDDRNVYALQDINDMTYVNSEGMPVKVVMPIPSENEILEPEPMLAETETHSVDPMIDVEEPDQHDPDFPDTDMHDNGAIPPIAPGDDFEMNEMDITDFNDPQ